MRVNGYDIAIIGGGVIGLSLARALIAAKARVIVIDAAGAIPPATNAAAGMLAPSFETGARDPAALYRFSVESLDMWPAFARNLEAETGIEIDYRDGGILGVAFDEAQAAALRASCERIADPARAEMISGGDAQNLEPALSAQVTAALLARGDGQVDARRLLAALKVSFSKTGGVWRNARVEKAVRQGAGYALTVEKNETIEADRLVLASGAASMTLIADLPSPPVYPVKGEAAALKMAPAQFQRVIRGPGAYLCPKAGGRVVIGATERDGVCDIEVADAAIAELREAAARLVPASGKFPEIERWAGLRPATPDGAPILGCDPRGPDNLFLALGHYRNGVLLAPATANALAQEITREAALTGPKPFRPDRFGTAQAGAPHG